MIAAPLNLIVTRGVVFGPLVLVARGADDLPVDLTGYTPLAQVRQRSGEPVLDLAPALTVPEGGRIEIGKFTDEQTLAMINGSYKWDLVLQDPDGDRHGPYLAGSFKVKEVVTRTAA